MTASLPRERATHVAAVLLVLHVLAHAPGITHPPLDDHAWRQADTAAVARNLVEESFDPLHPRVDARREHGGITGMEFPLYNTVVALLHKAEGRVEHWHARAVSVLAGALAAWFMFRLARLRGTPVEGVLTMGALLTSPLFFYSARNMQPDVLMLAGIAGAAWRTAAYAADARRRDLLVAAMWMGMAMLVKPTAVFAGVPLLVMLHAAGRLRARELALVALVSGPPVLAWYVHAGHLDRDYGLAGHFNLHEDPSVLLGASYWIHVYGLRPASSVTTVVGAALCLVGAWRAWRTRHLVVGSWLVAGVAYQLVFASKTLAHVYYSLPLTLPVAWLAALGAVELMERRGWSIRALVTVGVAMAINTSIRVRPWYALRDTELLRLERVLDEAGVSRDARVVVNGGPSPSMLYFAHRKGWTVETGELTDEFLRACACHGATHVVVDRHRGVAPAWAAGGDADFAVVPLAGRCP